MQRGGLAAGVPPQSLTGELEWILSILESRGFFSGGTRAHGAAWLSAHTWLRLIDYRLSEGM